MNNMLSLDKKLEMWEASLPNDKLILLTYAVKKDMDRLNDMINKSVDACYAAAIADETGLGVKEIREIIERAYFYMNDLKRGIEEDEYIMERINEVEEQVIEFLEKEMKKGTLKSEAVLKAKKKFKIPAKDASNAWLAIKEGKYDGKKAATDETKKKVSESVRKANEEKKKLKIKTENKAHTEEEKQGNVITPKTENEAIEEATEVQKEEIKSTLVEITEVRKFKGQFGEYEKSKDGVKIEDLLVNSKEDADKLGNELVENFNKELEEFVKKQEEKKIVAFGRLEEIKQLLEM